MVDLTGVRGGSGGDCEANFVGITCKCGGTAGATDADGFNMEFVIGTAVVLMAVLVSTAVYCPNRFVM
jgi:hypothetical protein